MSDPAAPAAGPAAHRATRPALRFGEVLGVVPFVAFAVLFLLLPMLYLIGAAFTAPGGGFTLENLADLAQPRVISAFSISLRLSAATALLGTAIGLAIALAVIRGGLPGALRSAVMTFSGVASNFAGVPLAFAFIATIGRLGVLTLLLRGLGLDPYRAGFNLFSFWGLTLTYLYFQIPLMVLIIAPAVDALKKEWSEAAAILGATPLQYWRHVGLPVLFPSLLGCLALLFANAFGAIATAFALTGSSLNIVPIVLYAQIRGDALQNPGLGAALALGMIVVTALANIVYLAVSARTERWRR